VICQGNDLCTGCSRFHHFSLLFNLIVFYPTFVVIRSLNLAGGGWRTAGRFLFVECALFRISARTIFAAFLMGFARIVGHIPVIIKSRTNRELEELSKGENVVKWIKGQRLTWLGHLERMEENRMPKNIFTQELEGRRRRRRPRKGR